MAKSPPDPAESRYRAERVAHWDAVARKRDTWTGWGSAYHRRLREVYQTLVSPGLRVLEIGCGTGELLAALRPAQGIGVDFSAEMLDRARKLFPQLEFFEADACDLAGIGEHFDVIILSDLVNDLWDVELALRAVLAVSDPATRIIINFHSGLWQLPLATAQRINLASPMLAQNWLTPADARGMLHLAGFDTIRAWHEMLWPFGFGGIFNKFLVRFWPFSQLALTNFMIARPVASREIAEPRVSVIVPARNEAGNIGAIFERLPSMGTHTELIFVEGHSQDDTPAEIERQIRAHPGSDAILVQQNGIGKADAVRAGFSRATGDALMILDADLTVRPEDLPRFLDALVSGRGEFINGVRLVYPMEKQAMRGLNIIGNKLFSVAFSWILGQSIKDTLCGTKVLWRRDYEMIAANRGYFGEFDPFGDYDLIFGAAKLNRRIVDLPIRYRERTYGSTNISRWRHGALLFRMVWIAALRLKFV